MKILVNIDRKLRKLAIKNWNFGVTLSQQKSFQILNFQEFLSLT